MVNMGDDAEVSDVVYHRYGRSVADVLLLGKEVRRGGSMERYMTRDKR